MPERADLDAIYAGEYFNAAEGETGGQGYQDYVGDESLHRLNARRRIAALNALAPTKGALLDVGAAAGFFVDEARRDGWSARGIDIASSMTRYATQRLAVDVRRTTLADATLADQSLDAVTMWDYIEHAIEPFADLARVARVLKPRGVIGISTGDVDSFVAQISGSRWHLLTPRHHNFFFSRATLERALSAAGFEVVAVRHQGAMYPLSYLIYKFQTIARLGFLEQLAARLRGTSIGDCAVPLNLADIVTIWGRRR